MTKALRDELYAKYWRMIPHVIGRFLPVKSMQSWQVDDATQDLSLLLLRCLDRYDESHESKASLGTYIYDSLMMYTLRLKVNMVRWRAKVYSRNHQQYTVRMRLFSEMGYGFEYSDLFAKIPPAADVAAETEEFETVVHTVKKRMKPRIYRAMMMRHFEEKTFDECGKSLGVCKQRAAELANAGVRKARRILGDNFGQ